MSLGADHKPSSSHHHFADIATTTIGRGMAEKQPTTQRREIESEPQHDRAEPGKLEFWGWKSIRRQIGSGVFACPSEATERAYWVYRIRRWLTIFSMPVFPAGVVGEQIECFCCGNIYGPAVLESGVTNGA